MHIARGDCFTQCRAHITCNTNNEFSTYIVQFMYTVSITTPQRFAGEVSMSCVHCFFGIIPIIVYSSCKCLCYEVTLHSQQSGFYVALQIVRSDRRCKMYLLPKSHSHGLLCMSINSSKALCCVQLAYRSHRWACFYKV